MSSTFKRYLSRRPRLVDAMVIVGTYLCTLSASVWGTFGATDEVSPWPGVVLSAVACLALWWHRSRPREVVAVAALCTSAAASFGYLPTSLLLAPAMAALFWLATRADRVTANLYALGAIAVLLPSVLLFAEDHDTGWLLITVNPAISLLLPTVWGRAVQARRAYLDSLRTRAELAEATREQEAQQRVADERVRIARELHDVVAHHLALANAQAGTAVHLLRRNPDQAEQLLTDLAGTTASALRELKATVGLLRGPGDLPPADLEPAPGLGGLPGLVTALDAAGLHVVVTTEGTPVPLAPGSDLAAYRIVQEALTNVAKHAESTTAQVQLAYQRERLTITISNKGKGRWPPASPGGGYGLIGMRERAESAGGSFHADRRPDGGFTVTATLPFRF